MRGEYFSVFLLCLMSQPIEVPAEADLDDDEGAEFLVEGGRVWVWGIRKASGVCEIRGFSMSGGEKLLGLFC